MLDQKTDHAHVLSLGGEMHRKRVVAFVANVRVGPPLEQDAHDRFVFNTEMQRSAEAGMARQLTAVVDDVWMFVEDARDFAHVPLARGTQ